VHRIAKDAKKDQVNQEIEENGYYPPFNTSFYKENDKDFYNYTQNPHDYNNFSNDSSNYGYYNNEPFFSYSNFTSQNKANSEFNVVVEIKIQKGLKIIENYLKNYPKPYVAKRISELRSRCIRAQSDDPLKKYPSKWKEGRSLALLEISKYILTLFLIIIINEKEFIFIR
jgi:hypothetical protein